MAATSSKAVLITGANVGLGKEVARQLALTGDFDRIYLACRNADSGQSAAFDLQRLTGRPIFSVVRMDLTDVDSVRSALNTLDGPLHSVVMNAGGTGGPTPLALTADGVTHVFGSNVLGHVVLLENLLAAGALTNAAVLVGSEAARGVRMMRMPRPTFTDHSVEEFVSVIDGSYFTQHEFNTFLAYGQVKYLGALWMSALARQHPDLRLLTVSPGNTAGTDALRDMGSVTRALMNHVMLPHVLPALGVGHQLEKGAKRLADGVTDDRLRSGVFYASRPGKVVGPLVDQSEIVADFKDPAIQQHAYEAIHRFVKESRSHRQSPPHTIGGVESR
ncbi:SDR family NAD(P)-dependent oxidoreductase [Mycobacterium hodleri]|uniref:SDR family NAD(P)-dependent oxidoreductase n=1 Tax=Mycolicibacterium hodleri TaxID=49897 RepID=UPI0021F267F2|nr:SDR family NAD(P)-dependent oxidoreductase [Mycolicibacterium hodleri]MCV7133249.1 SDR family NAD(P)-dependent oxidoreductase [Mycolicibacterium hodleri]